jgi:hypothetical protein
VTARTPRSVVICQIYNEELLLPFWLAHHRRLFDHGVILDYASTDRSRQIVEWSTPGWEVRPSRNEWFDAAEVDAEVMDVEAEFGEGVWKMALNVTEHLFTSRLDRITAQCAPETPALRLDVASMIDPPTHRALPVNPYVPLYLQRHHGVIGRRPPRYLHRAPRGEYGVGRHTTQLPCTPADGLVLWWGFSPFDATKPRKLQIGARIPEAAARKRWGFQHLVDDAGLEQMYREQQADVRDLLDEPRFLGPLLDICREWPSWRLVTST